MLRLALELSHPPVWRTPLCYVPCCIGTVGRCKRPECADALIALLDRGTALNFLHDSGHAAGVGPSPSGDNPGVGAAQMRRGLPGPTETPCELNKPYFLAWLAEACWKVGQIKEGLHVLGEALALVEQHKECWWEAELYRLKGALLLKQSVPDTKQAKLALAWDLDIARSQQVCPWNTGLVSLAPTMAASGPVYQAAQLLAPI